MILVIDNYDSFTYNLVQYLGEAGAQVQVARNDEISLEEVLRLDPKGILLSPGPCTPRESGVCLNIISAALNAKINIPLFGVCLGHQAIGEVSGATVRRAGRLMHGKASLVRHDGLGVFQQMENPFSAIRYHSLAIEATTLSPAFTVTATAEDDGEIMGIRHRSLPIEGVQFHPESILTQGGKRIVENFVASIKARAPRAA
ncbi:MAG: anthranilate/aminodeoxychorismate synthase component II [Armatimonadota bacterium]